MPASVLGTRGNRACPHACGCPAGRHMLSGGVRAYPAESLVLRPGAQGCGTGRGGQLAPRSRAQVQPSCCGPAQRTPQRGPAGSVGSRRLPSLPWAGPQERPVVLLRAPPGRAEVEKRGGGQRASPSSPVSVEMRLPRRGEAPGRGSSTVSEAPSPASAPTRSGPQGPSQRGRRPGAAPVAPRSRPVHADTPPAACGRVRCFPNSHPESRRGARSRGAGRGGNVRVEARPWLWSPRVHASQPPRMPTPRSSRPSQEPSGAPAQSQSRACSSTS